MEHLKYKTRGNLNPRGLQKVYFSCHPADFEGCFERIANEILEIHSCAIWYDTKQEDVYEEDQMKEVLGQMQLFVVPITKQFLYTQNRAREAEFLFAQKYHIPILPIIQDSRLTADFNRICGDLQYLDPRQKDNTVDSFEEKLEDYLNKVLIGEELAKKIRSAFDAYMFMSYRKKDRKYALELMKLIHKNEMYRDIAIWYDEFLTPGENYNDSISEAIENSEIFTMVITPNLVNEENYVMTIEYPMAKMEGKRILPIEMEETNRDELSKKYEGIQDVTNAGDEFALNDLLTAAAEKLSIKEKGVTPMHEFYIGLAYLGGIDVEIDYEKALKLITFAAENGIEEAIEKLRDMYRKGEGVERDYRKAIVWQEKLIEFCEKRYETDRGDWSTYKLVRELYMLLEYLNEINEYTRIQSWGRKLFSYIEGGAKVHPYTLQCIYARLGDTCRALRELDEAEIYYQKLEAVSKELADNSTELKPKRGLSICYERLMLISQARGDMEKAKEYAEKNLKHIQQIVLEYKQMDDCKACAVAYRACADFEVQAKKYKLAKKYYQNSLKLDLAAVATDRKIHYLYSLVGSYKKLFTVAEIEGSQEEMIEYLSKQLEVLEELMRRDGLPECYRDSIVTYAKLGEIYAKNQQFQLAQECFENSLKIHETQSKQYGMLLSSQMLSDISFNLANVYVVEKGYESAIELGEKSISMENRSDSLVMKLERLTEWCTKNNEVSKAEYYYENIIQICEILYHQEPEYGWHMGLIKNYCKLGMLYKDNQKFESAIACLEKTIELIKLHFDEDDILGAQEKVNGIYATLDWLYERGHS